MSKHILGFQSKSEMEVSVRVFSPIPQNQRLPMADSWIKYFGNEELIVNLQLVYH